METAEQKVRRVVTGHDAKGRSVVVSDTRVAMERPLHELWVTQGTPAKYGGAPQLGALPTQLEPAKGGTTVRFVRFVLRRAAAGRISTRCTARCSPRGAEALRRGDPARHEPRLGQPGFRAGADGVHPDRRS